MTKKERWRNGEMLAIYILHGPKDGRLGAFTYLERAGRQLLTFSSSIKQRL